MPPYAPQPSEADLALLEEVRLSTRMIRQHQEAIVELGQRRRKDVLKLRKRRVTYRRIAEAMETTEQAVYKVVRGNM